MINKILFFCIHLSVFLFGSFHSPAMSSDLDFFGKSGGRGMGFPISADTVIRHVGAVDSLLAQAKTLRRVGDRISRASFIRDETGGGYQGIAQALERTATGCKLIQRFRKEGNQQDLYVEISSAGTIDKIHWQEVVAGDGPLVVPPVEENPDAETGIISTIAERCSIM